MKYTLPLLVLLGALAPGAARAQSAMSLNHQVTNAMPHEQCMTQASNVMREAGLNLLPQTSEAVWGESADRRKIAAIYCLKTRDVAVFAVSGPSTEETRPIMSRLLSVWRGTQ